MRNDREKALADGIEALGLTVDTSQLKTMIAYITLLEKWNRTYNLTAVRNLDAMVAHHLLDSLAIAPFVIGDRVLDVGSGAGLPGIPLAIIYSKKNWVLLDSNGKKTRFLRQAVAELRLKNVLVVQARVQAYQANVLFDVILARALGSLHDIMTLARHCSREDGQFLLMKGAYPSEELSPIKSGELSKIKLKTTVHKLKVPGLDAERHLVIIENQK